MLTTTLPHEEHTLANFPGITAISDPDDVAFTAINEGFVRKHGRKRCPCCREEGVDRVVEIAPAVNGATRVHAAVCRDHENEGRRMLIDIWRSFEPDYSEAEYSLPTFR